MRPLCLAPMKNVTFLLLLCLAPLSPARGEVYQAPEAFLNEAFSGAPPQPNTLWLSKELRLQTEEILAHTAGFLRTRYWREDEKSAWILEETGKTKPITVGVAVNHGKIEKIKVLAFRESRGWEVKHPFFTDQFSQASLNQDLNLDKPIDGISGATLSVRALTKIARLALLFDRTIRQ